MTYNLNAVALKGASGRSNDLEVAEDPSVTADFERLAKRANRNPRAFGTPRGLKPAALSAGRFWTRPLSTGDVTALSNWMASSYVMTDGRVTARAAHGGIHV